MKQHPNPEHIAHEILASARENVGLLAAIRHDEPLLKRMIDTYISEKHYELDRRTYDAVTARLRAETETWKALGERERAKHTTLNVHRTLEQEDAKATLEHERDVAKLNREKFLDGSDSRHQLDQAWFDAEIKKYRKLAEDEGMAEQFATLLEQWTTGFVQHQHVKSAIDQLIDALYRRRVSSISKSANPKQRDAAIRAAKLEREDWTLDRDALLKDMTEYLRDQAAAQRRRKDDGGKGSSGGPPVSPH